MKWRRGRTEDVFRAQVHKGEHPEAVAQGAPVPGDPARWLRRSVRRPNAPWHPHIPDRRTARHGHRTQGCHHQPSHRRGGERVRLRQSPDRGPGGRGARTQPWHHGTEAIHRPGEGMALPPRWSLHRDAHHGRGCPRLPGGDLRKAHRRPSPHRQVPAGTHQVLWRAQASVDAGGHHHGGQEEWCAGPQGPHHGPRRQAPRRDRAASTRGAHRGVRGVRRGRCARGSLQAPRGPGRRGPG